MPILRLPVPENPNPGADHLRGFPRPVATFVTELANRPRRRWAVRSDKVKLVLDLDKLRYDANGDGTVGDDERFVRVIERVTGMPVDDAVFLVFAFDKGDALWLDGYCKSAWRSASSSLPTTGTRASTRPSFTSSRR